MKIPKIQNKGDLYSGLVFGSVFIVLGMFTSSWSSMLIGIVVVILGWVKSLDRGEEEQTSRSSSDILRTPCQTFYGDELNFSKETIATCLSKHFPYYNELNEADKKKFVSRTDEFICDKTFKIHDKQGFREMPILVSASAVQLSFGLKNYLLPQYENIHIYPEEFMRFKEGIHFLAGNVSGTNINISWKHFLDGYNVPDDGQNVGLHEMAHAYYYQNFVCEEDEDKKFIRGFPQFNSFANKAFEQEKMPGYDLYSEYALTNFQEFWAESIEIFFEKPAYLNNTYPELYSALRELLNQDPMNKVASMT